MRRRLRTLAAVLAGLALVAALPAPCGCAPQRSTAEHADEHACCAPPIGVSAADDGCCNESPGLAEGLVPPAASADAAPLALATLPVAARSLFRAFAQAPVPLVPSPPPSVLRI